MATSKLRSKEVEDAVGEAILNLLKAEGLGAKEAIQLKVVEAYLKAVDIAEPETGVVTAHTNRAQRTLDRLKEPKALVDRDLAK